MSVLYCRLRPDFTSCKCRFCCCCCWIFTSKRSRLSFVVNWKDDSIGRRYYFVGDFKLGVSNAKPFAGHFFSSLYHLECLAFRYYVTKTGNMYLYVRSILLIGFLMVMWMVTHYMALFSFLATMVSEAHNSSCHLAHNSSCHAEGHFWSSQGTQPADHEYDTLGYFSNEKTRW